MRNKFMAATSCLVAALALGVTACGDDDDERRLRAAPPRATEAKNITVYSSLPLQGASRVQTEAMVNGIKLALEQAGSKAGTHTIKYVSLDDSTAQAGSWTPEAESANALKAAQDDATGRLHRRVQLGRVEGLDPDPERGRRPADLARQHVRGPDHRRAGLEPGEPDKYYPTGERTYARIVPKDTIQAAALVTLMKQDGCTKVAMTNDKEVYGAGLAAHHRVLRQGGSGLELTGNDAIDKNAANYRSLASEGQGGRRRLLRVRGHHRQQRGPAVQGLRGGAAGREALRPGRRRRVRLRPPRRTAASPPT